MRRPTAAILIVGDEILSGHTLDTNSHWLAQRLFHRGVRVLRKETVPDDEAEIEATLRRLLVREEPDFVFVVGGIGPTPDDRTYAGVARALEVERVLRPQHVAWARKRARDRGLAQATWADPNRSEAARRMIQLPAGSRALLNPVGSALGCVARAGPSRVVVLPGVPRELYAMFEQSFERPYLARFEPAEATRELELWGAEAQFWDLFRELETSFPSVRLGSYPQDSRGRILVRLQGPAPDLQRAYDRLKKGVAAQRPKGPTRRVGRSANRKIRGPSRAG